MTDYFRDVGDFHAKFGLLKVGDAEPHLLDSDTYNFRKKFMLEELAEFEHSQVVGDLAKATDALADLVYVALGTAHLMGVPMDRVWREVQRANMAKERATSADDARSLRRHRLDVVKPAGWKPPDVEGAIFGSKRVVGKWDHRYAELARHVAGWSLDPTTKVGAVVVGKDSRKIAIGYNGFPPGIADDQRIHDRETKHALTQHAERNAMDNAEFDVRGGTLATTLFPCHECAKSIVSRGIRRVVTTPQDLIHEPWKKSAALAREILDEAGVEVEEVDP